MIRLFLSIFCFLCTTVALAAAPVKTTPPTPSSTPPQKTQNTLELTDTEVFLLSLSKQHPLYVAGFLGYGNTDWNMLSNNCDPNDADPEIAWDCTMIRVASPSKANDSGAAEGITFGYEVQPHFAMELTFAHFPTSTLTFSQGNYYFKDDHDVTINTESDAMWFVAKFMAQIADLPLRGYANAGLDITYRNDTLATIVQPEPTFGVGMDYIFRNRIQLELGFQYVAGYGEASVTPANEYVPFLYTVYGRLGYYI